MMALLYETFTAFEDEVVLSCTWFYSMSSQFLCAAYIHLPNDSKLHVIKAMAAQYSVSS